MRPPFRPLEGAGTGIAMLMVGAETAVVEDVVAFIARTAAGTAVGATVGGIRGAMIGAGAIALVEGKVGGKIGGIVGQVVGPIVGPTAVDVIAGSTIRGGMGKRGSSRGGCTARGPFPW